MARRWVFTRRKDQPTLWTWRLLGPDGRTDQQAGDFQNYGEALQDAIHNGFRPREDDWVVENAREVTRHQHGQKPLVILKQDPTTIPPGTVFTDPGSPPSIDGTHPETQ